MIATAAVERRPGTRRGCSGNAREGALIDLTGQWVSVITEDWRWRMVTPPKGDTASVPLNPAGRKVAEAWDLGADRRAARCARRSGRRVDSTARTAAHPMGERQHAAHGVRRRNADPPLPLRRESPAGARSLQGTPRRGGSGSRRTAASSAQSAPTRGGSLEVVTTNLHGGYLRPNGVPYSERTIVKEFFDSFTLPEDGTWLIVTTVVDDPEYLTQEFVISSQFKKERSVEMESAAMRDSRRRSLRRGRRRDERRLLALPGQAGCWWPPPSALLRRSMRSG